MSYVCESDILVKSYYTQEEYLDDFLQGSSSAEEFMQQLPKFDEELTEILKDAESSGEVSNQTLFWNPD